MANKTKKIVSYKRKKLEENWQVPQKEIIDVRIFRVIGPAFIIVVLSFACVLYANTQLQKQVFMAPDETSTFLDVPKTYWYWVIGLAIALIILLILLITIVILNRSHETHVRNKEMIEQAKTLVANAKSSGYTNDMIKQRFKDQGWSDSEIDQLFA